MDRLTPRDERETSVDQAADRLAYLVLSFGLLAIAAYRSFVAREGSWDLIGLVLIGGFVGTAYRIQQRAGSRRWVLVLGGTVAVGLLIAAVTAFVARA
jgi:hypothetical protein